MTLPRFFAVVPAAGQSTRMGCNKLLLKTSGRTILEHVIFDLMQGEVSHVVVLVGPDAMEVGAIAREAGADVCALTQATQHMRATVERGLTWLEQQFRPCADDAWFLTPADHPGIDASVVRQLREQFASSPPQPILVPTYQGKRGHPTLFCWSEVAGIRAYPANLGLNSYLRANSSRVCEVAVAKPGVLSDIDEPADYEHLRSMP
jgi:molybdenum cofactor cytidylyltransferase